MVADDDDPVWFDPPTAHRVRTNRVTWPNDTSCSMKTCIHSNYLLNTRKVTGRHIQHTLVRKVSLPRDVGHSRTYNTSARSGRTWIPNQQEDHD